jgi:hypothetical protein
MAAFTEGFTDTTKPGANHIGSMISKVLAARKFARQEREVAEEKAKKAGYDSLEEAGVEKGFFFKAALKNKFGGSYISGKKQDIEQAVDRVKLLKNPKAQFWNFVDNRDADGKEKKKLSDVEMFRKQFDNYNFQSAKRPPEGVKAETPAIPKKMSPFELEQKRQALSQEKMLAEAEKKVADAASGSKQRASREDLLQAINAIAQSLDKTAQSINNSIGDSKQVASDIHAMKTDVVSQLSERTDSIEDKLSKIAEAINAQTALKKKQTDDAEGTVKEANQEKQEKLVTTNIPDNTNTPDIDESASNVQLDYDPGDENDDTSLNDITQGPQAERGAILSGPDSGYKVPGLTLHGNEAIVPLDNNYTQGEPSAVDGKVRPTPSEPMVPPMNVNVNNSYEMGKSPTNINNSYETGTPMGKSSPIEIPNLMGDSSLEQPLVDAMALPTKIAGGMALAASSELVKRLSGDSPEVASEMAKVITPLASVFDLPKSLVGKAKSGESLGKDSSILTGGGNMKDEKKNIFQKAFEGLKNLFKGGKKPPGGPGDKTPARARGGGMTGTQEQREYAGDIYEMAKAAGAKHPEVAAAMAALETGWGGSEHGNNPFNLRNEDGSFMEFETREDAVKEFVRLWDKNHSGYMNLEAFDDPNEAVANIIHAYAPASDGNDPEAYKQFIANFLKGKMYLKNPPRKVEDPETPETKDLEKPQPDSAQKITENFGLNPDQKFYFMHKKNGVDLRYEAYKTTKGFAIYKHGGQIGSTLLDTSDGRNDDVVESLIKAGRARVEAAKKVTPPPKIEPPVKSEEKQASLRGVSPAEKAKVAMINIGGEQTQSAATGAVPTSQGTTVAPSVSSLSKSVFTVDGVTA